MGTRQCVFRGVCQWEQDMSVCLEVSVSEQRPAEQAVSFHADMPLTFAP